MTLSLISGKTIFWLLIITWLFIVYTLCICYMYVYQRNQLACLIVKDLKMYPLIYRSCLNINRWLIITFPLLGIGFGLACTPSIMAVEQHFYKQRMQALSVVLSGVGAGIVVFPVLIRTLLDHLAWRGTLWILSGIALNLCVCGALMSPVAHGKQVHLMPLLSCVPLRNITFHGMCIANLFWSFGSTVIYMYLPSYAMDEGSSFETSVFLVSCVGMASFTSRVIFSFMGHNSTLDDMTAILCSIGLGVVITGICPLLFDDYAGQIGYSILFGFYSGYWTTFLSQASRELLGPECIAKGNGYLSFMIALGSIMAGPAAGMFFMLK